MITAASAARRRWGVKDDEESPYLSLPYDTPSSGQYFGPASIGGPPGSRNIRNSYKLRNALSSQIVLRLQQRFTGDYGEENVSATNCSNDTGKDGKTRNADTFVGPTLNTSNSWPLLDTCINNESIDMNNSTALQYVSNMHLQTKIENEIPFKDNINLYNHILSKSKNRNTDSLIFSNSYKSNDNSILKNEKYKESNSGSKIVANGLGNTTSAKKMNNATSLSDISNFESYSQVKMNDQPVVVVPPLITESLINNQPIRTFNLITNLIEDQCRKAMISYASQSCCFGQKPALEHEIKQITPPRTLHYILESFTEKRTVQYACEPCSILEYSSNKKDGKTSLEKPTPPPPWSVDCEPDKPFHQQTKQMKIPDTLKIEVCHACVGKKKISCGFCNGSGKVECFKCDATGNCPHYIPNQNITKLMTCSTCKGEKVTSCRLCGGNGYQKCATCDGQGQLKCFLQLNVKYTTHHNDFVMEEMELPPELHEQVTGILIYEQQLPQVFPLTDYPVLEVVENSRRLIDEHRSKCFDERLIYQRQSLWALPVTEVQAEWKGIRYRYWVYGKDQNVYCPDYPHRCCGCLGSHCCTIL